MRRRAPARPLGRDGSIKLGQKHNRDVRGSSRGRGGRGDGEMGWVRMRVRVRSPPVMQSKLLCLSLLYLLTTLPLALYVSFSDPASAASRCLVFLPFRSSAPSSAASAALFEYPREYGEHKHAIPATRALCSDPAVFSGRSLSVREGRNGCLCFSFHDPWSHANATNADDPVSQLCFSCFRSVFSDQFFEFLEFECHEKFTSAIFYSWNRL